MANKELQTRIIHKHDTAANWEANASFIPKQGELIVYDADDNFTYERFKIGDGTTTVANLPFMPGPADSVLVVTATPVTDEIAATNYTSQQIIEHINNGGTSMMLYNDLMLPLRIIEPENAEVGYSTTMVTEGQAEVQSEVTTMMIEVNGNTATTRRANYDPAKAGFLKNADIYDKTYIDEKVVELNDAIANKRDIWYGVCNTESDVAVKEITTESGDFELKKGSIIYVTFNKSNTVSITKLNIDGVGEQNVFAANHQNTLSYILPYTIGYHETVAFVYTGSYFMCINGNRASTSYYGITKLEDSVESTSIETAATPYAVKRAYDLASSANTTASEIGPTKTAVTELQVELDDISKHTIMNVFISESEGVYTADKTYAEIISHIANGGGVVALLSGTGYSLQLFGVSNDAVAFAISMGDDSGYVTYAAYITADGVMVDEYGYTFPEVFTGATSNSSGDSGLVPEAAIGDTSSALFSDGTWKSTYTKTEIDAQKTSVDTQIVDINTALESKATAGHGIYYGTCSTAATTATKAVTLTDKTGFSLITGVVVAVKFTNYNSASSPKLNVAGTGAKPIYKYGTSPAGTTTEESWLSGAVQIFIYDGTGWIRDFWDDDDTTYTNAKLGHGYGTCSTAASTTAKSATLSNYIASVGGTVAIKFDYDVPANATLNINNKGAKSIYYRGAQIADNVIKAEDVATFIYNGNYHLLAIDRWQKDIDTLFARTAELNMAKAPAEHTHNIADIADLTPAAIGASESDHTHDDRYYTEAEMDDKLSDTANKSEGAFFIEGSGTTDATNKVSTWTGTSDRITEYYDGLTIRYKIGVAGQTTVTLNINNLGAKTVYRFSSTKLSTQFPVGSIIHLIYHSDLNGGCWVTNDYDANTNTYQRVYESSGNVEYPITARYNTTDGSTYYAEYGRYTNGVTLNPSKNTITATTFKGNLTGNADTATEADHADTADTATKAIKDGDDNVITATYAKKATTLTGYGIGDAYTKTEIDNLILITEADIDVICGATIQVATTSEVTF